MDLDDVLIRLWEAGIDDVLDPADALRRDVIPTARTVLGLACTSDARSISSWAMRLDITEDEMRTRLSEIGVIVSPTMRNLPKGSVAKVRKLLGDPAPPVAVAPEVPAKKDIAINAPLEWRPIGKIRNQMNYLRIEDAIEIHEYMVKQFAETSDPIQPPGVKHLELLSSAISRPQTSLGGVLKYPTAELAAAALLHSLTLNHPFHNGNKRTALVSMLVFLDSNDMALMALESDVLKLVVRLARRSIIPEGSNDRNDREVQEVANWIRQNQRSFTHGDRPLQFRVLRRILGGFACDFDYPNTGNRLNISRTVEERTFLGRPRTSRLETQVHYHSVGADVARTTINKIRQELRLDEEHGCDSAAFYNSGIETIDQVIAQYQTTLKRLAKL